MRKSKKRGCVPPKTHDRTCTRRTRKRAHQAGCPDFGNGCHCHGVVDSMMKAFNRLAYAVRVGKVKRGLVRELRSYCPPRKLPKSGLAGLPGGRSVSFVPAKKPDSAYVKPVDYKPSLRRIKLSRVSSIPLIGWDARTADSPLEDKAARVYRLARARGGGRILPTLEDMRTPLFTNGERAVMKASVDFRTVVGMQSGGFDIDRATLATPPLVLPRVKASTAVIQTCLELLRSESRLNAVRTVFGSQIYTYRLPGYA